MNISQVSVVVVVVVVVEKTRLVVENCWLVVVENCWLAVEEVVVVLGGSCCDLVDAL